MQPAQKHWDRLGGIKPYHGIVTPLLALRSDKSLGSGDFLDLLSLIDWVSESGLTLLQLLPVNDTGYDASPYAALSAFSLNPIYISLSEAPLMEGELEALRALEKLEQVPYEELRKTKMAILASLIGRGWGKERYSAYQKSKKPLKRLDDYAKFMALKDHFDLKPWWEWPEYSEKLIEELAQEIRFYQTLQLIAKEQLERAHAHATLKGISLVGDLPILLCKDSSEVYFDRDLFHLDLAAGAPPDQFSPEGQNWGFPTYNWQEVSERGYSWWQERLSWSEGYFDLYRIDHVAGFFGIWSIHPGKKAIEGFYDPSDPAIRLELGKARLKVLLESSTRLPLGEDLGHIDPRIRDQLLSLGIPGMKVMRWHRHWDEGGAFFHPREYPKMSLACVSTHDSSTLRQWFDEDKEGAKALSELLGVPYPEKWNSSWSQAILKACHGASSSLHLNLLVDFLDAFEPLMAEKASEYRINVPSVIEPTNWTLRYKKTIDEMRAFKPLMRFWRSLCKL